MTHTFPELIIGGVLVAPFVPYLVTALFAIIILRPILHLIGLAGMFSNPSIAQLSLFVTILGLLMLLF